MKRIISMVLALLLVVGTFGVPTMAAGENYTFTLTVNGKDDAACLVGDTITVALHIKNNNADSIELYSMQDYINFDSAYLQFVEGSESFFKVDGYEVISGSILPSGNQVFTNRAGRRAISMKNGDVLMQFKLKALKAGSVNIISSGTEMIGQNSELYSVALKNAKVNISVPHTHNMKYVEQKAATVNAVGMKAHWTCTDCGKLFLDKEGTKEVSAKDLEIPKLKPTPTPKPEPVIPGNFTDVPAGAWYAQAVKWAANNNITQGITATQFRPNMNCTRAQAVTFLWRAAGCPNPQKTSCKFKDVPKSAYYRNAVLWAVEKGVTNGVTSTKFSPNATCNRSQIVTFLWRAKGSPSASGKMPFKDVHSSDYYRTAVKWAVKNGITEGMSSTKFGPNRACNRAQIVTFLWRAR